MSRSNQLWRLSLASLMLGLFLPTVPESAAGPFDQLTDLSGKANVVVTLKGRDNFNSEYRYDVSVKNLSADTFMGDSLFIVLDKITNIGGEDREALNSDTILSRMEVLGQDGETENGKPYFQIPAGSGTDLAPYSQSRPVTVRLRNKDYLIVFTPSFKVFGLKRQPAAPKPAEQPAASASGKNSVDKLIQLLIKKGILSEADARALNQP